MERLVSAMENSESNSVLPFESFFSRLGREARLWFWTRYLFLKAQYLLIKTGLFCHVSFLHLRIFLLKTRYAILVRW